jgi:hypothetical protein
LFTTSWLIDDANRPGVMLFSSASSKTAYGMAFMLA